MVVIIPSGLSLTQMGLKELLTMILQLLESGQATLRSSLFFRAHLLSYFVTHGISIHPSIHLSGHPSSHLFSRLTEGLEGLWRAFEGGRARQGPGRGKGIIYCY